MKNLFMVFVAPQETFERVKENKTAWILPLVVLMVFSAISIYLQMPFIEKGLIEQFQKQQIDPSAQEALIQTTKISGFIISFIMTAAGVFIWGLLLMLLNLIVRGKAKYMQLVTLAAFATLPGILNSLLTTVMVSATDGQALSDVSLSLGAFVSDKSSQLYELMSIINPFTIWGVIMYVVGASVMMQRPRKTVGMWIISLWLVLSIGPLLIL
ncbi:YIP1 family protein [Paenibacillus segetis]|uniref:Yip1 domain-containing protein n=1 Tax=Paenibacillus segetis TaxID=1325360 RepID=A0ABQ1YVX3_9BACL|nr:YIP1 family protein [Paenibacillus segetis]GGH38382.1 hypothetical protein GCM10008013_46410 [Paenibacillus segetis]